VCQEIVVRADRARDVALQAPISPSPPSRYFGGWRQNEGVGGGCPVHGYQVLNGASSQSCGGLVGISADLTALRGL
jgi:hypothetical protein